jgi:hypothetical protein
MVKKISKNCLFVLFYALSLNAYAKDGQPFIHPFGELRVYYQDWLVVCEDKGQGVCRMVKMNLPSKKEHFFGTSQLTVYPGAQQPRKSAVSEYANLPFISFFKRGIPALQGVVDIAVDGKTIAQLQPNQHVFDNSSNETSKKPIAMETYWLEGDTAGQIIDTMRHGRLLSVRYWHNNTQMTENFSLRGAAQALAFIQNKVAATSK